MGRHIRTAVHSIEYNHETTGEPLTAAPGVTFDVPDATLKDFEDMGAIRDATDAEIKAFREQNPLVATPTAAVAKPVVNAAVAAKAV